jgi:ubiquinone/menaquinone biosynthesis C-methylase UbiE
MFQRFFAQQLARPSGWFGRCIMPRWLRKHTLAVNTWAIEHLAIQPEDRLLEIGFGGGELLAQTLSKHSSLLAAGIDLSEEMVHLVRKRLGSFIREARLDILQGTVDQLPFENARFTKIISVNTLYFWPSPVAALAECRRVLEIGGQCALCFDAKEDLARWSGHEFGFTLYETAEVERLFCEARFAVLGVDTCHIPGYGKAHCIVAQAV